MSNFKDQNLERLLLELAQEEPGVSIQEVVAKAHQASTAPSYLVARCLYRLKLDGRVLLDDPQPPTEIFGYIKSHYGSWLWATLALIFSTVSSIYLLPNDPPFIYCRYILGSMFVLYLPGYAIIEALYPKREDLDSLERLALSIGLSLALVPLIGLILNYTPWGIRLDPFLVSLTLITMALAFAAALRKVGYIRLSYAVSRP